MVIASLTPSNQFPDANAPILPSERVKFNYEGKNLIVYEVPTEAGIKEWALYKPSRQSSEFIDPMNPEAGTIPWQGSWRTLKAVYQFKPTLDYYKEFFNVTNLPLLFKNTLIIAILSEFGVLFSVVMIVPVTVLFLSQRFLMEDMIVTQIEK